LPQRSARSDLGFFVKHEIQRRPVHLDFAVVVDEAKLAEASHGMADPRPGGSNHVHRIA
jgi:hypothetical protein